MNIGLIGYGKMGKIIAEIAQNRSHTIHEIIDPRAPEKTSEMLMKETTSDVYIDFSTPTNIRENIRLACAYKKNIVVGTTGWTDDLPNIQKMVQEAGIGFIWASNFSPAVQMFFRTARQAAKIANSIPESDAAIWEAHHRHKIDSPSGTAITLGETILEEMKGKKTMLFDRPEKKISPEELHVSSIRVGEVPGTHTALFDFPSETVEVKCTSRNRSGFALGAVLAAEWIREKKGFYCFDAVFEEIVR